MKVISERFLRGPNLYSRKPCFLAIVDLEDLAETSSIQVPNFVDVLLAAVPSLQEHGCCYGVEGGFVRRLRQGTYPAHIIEHLTIELQRLVGGKVSFGKAREVIGRPRHYRIVCAYEHESLVSRSFRVAFEMIGRLAHGELYDLAGSMEELRSTAERCLIGPSTGAILKAAKARDIPFRRLLPESSLFVMGQGVHRRRIRATITSQTSSLATATASDKHLTKQLMEDAGLPVPCGEVVRDADAAVLAFHRLHAPVTVKPLDSSQGRGVTPYANCERDVRIAFGRAREYGEKVIVERHISGNDYRILVVDGQLVAAAKRSPPFVIGDGRVTVRKLVEQQNLNPVRSNGHAGAMTKIPLDDHTLTALSNAGFTLDTVLPKDQQIVLRANANLSTGGVAEDVTDSVHPDIAQACLRAARCIGLDVAGIDLVCEDIGRPLSGQRGGFIEVNAAPGIRMHEMPAAGQSRPAGEAILRSLFPGVQNGRIPIVAVTGTNGKTTTALAIAHILAKSGLKVGTAVTGGVRIGDHWVTHGDCSGPFSARTILEDDQVEAAVLEVARGGILKRGLGFDKCDVSVVLNVSADHLGQDDIPDVQTLATVKAVVADAATKALVLNADNAYTLAMQEHCREGAEVWLFSQRPDSTAVAAHLAAGKPAVIRSGNDIYWTKFGECGHVCSVQDIPITVNGQASFNVENSLAAIAAGLALGTSLALIRSSLASFAGGVEQNPLRMNLFSCDGVTIVVDYAHNVASCRAILEFAQSLGCQRVLGVITAPGDRQDGDLAAVGAVCSSLLDEMVVYENVDRRGRAVGEISSAILAGRANSDGTAEAILSVREASARAFERCLPGDVLVLACADALSDLGELYTRMVPLDLSKAAAAYYQARPTVDASSPSSRP